MISVIGKYIVGKEVVHNTYGKGKVLDYNNGVVTVEHEDGIHKFGYPVGFYRNLKMLDLLLEDFQTARIVEFDSTEAIIEESYERILNKVRKIRLNWVYRGTDIELIRELGFNINEDRTKEEENEDIWTIKEGYDFDVWMPYLDAKERKGFLQFRPSNCFEIKGLEKFYEMVQENKKEMLGIKNERRCVFERVEGGFIFRGIFKLNYSYETRRLFALDCEDLEIELK